MSGINGKSREGNRIRSLSESDSEQISNASFTPELSSDQDPGLISSIDIYAHNSNPNLTTNPGVLLETPVGVGMGTRFQLRQVGGKTAKQEKALKDCEVLIKEADKWLEDMYAESRLDFDRIYEGAERFKRRIARTSQEALIRLIDRSVVDRLASIQISIEKLRKKAEREDKKQTQGNAIPPPLLNPQTPTQKMYFNPRKLLRHLTKVIT